MNAQQRPKQMFTEPPEPSAPPELLTIEQVRRHFVPLSRRTLFKMISVGSFPTADLRIGKKIRMWKPETIRKWIEKATA